jgi:hypothetical protein
MGNLFDESPIIQKLKKQWELEGYKRGVHITIMTIIQVWFPSLGELAQQKLAQEYSTEQLLRLHEQILSASDEKMVRILLMSTDRESR